MPAAIDISTWVTAYPQDGRTVTVFSENFQEEVTFDLNNPAPPVNRHWHDYVRGVAVTLEQAGYRLSGARLRIRSDVPIGSGLSSSAAVEVATGYALLRQSGFQVNPNELAKLCQRAENDFVGMRCGIMDQFISCHGERGKAIVLDCRSLEYEAVPLPSDLHLVICNTMVKHELANGEYNRRRAQCEQAAQHFANWVPGVRALRDVTLEEFESHGYRLPETIYRRCRHVITENTRVLEAAAALKRGDATEFGRLMYQSHRSLQHDYEVSCEELDLMVNLAQDLPGVYGARMTGGGFGGCTVNLVSGPAVEEFKNRIAQSYQRATGITPAIYICRAENGAREEVPAN